MNNHSGRPETILPGDFSKRLLRLQKSSSEHDSWSTQVESYTLAFTLSLFRDLSTCHLYVEDITERTKSQQKLRYQAFHDLLTELPNRRNLEEQAAKLITERQNRTPFALMFLNLDRFDLITASSGYNVGDQLIKTAARHLHSQLSYFNATPNYCQLFRFDGTTFSILISDMQAGPPEKLAQYLQNSMEQPLCAAQQNFYLTLSIGFSLFPRDGLKVSTLVKNANAALARIKSAGGHSITSYHPDMHTKEQAWIAIESGLRHAIEKQSLLLYYQPKVLTKNSKLVGVEALIRWRKENGEMISPAEFIPVAEQTGLIVIIGEWVLRQAFAQCYQWSQSTKVSMAVNLSTRQFQHHDFIRTIAGILQETNVDPTLIEIEITESLLMQNLSKAIETMRKLKAFGFKLSIDDFGTGYSSLNYLHQFPLDKLKIDRSFIANLSDSQSAQAIVRSIISLAHNLELTTVAEGVETQQQLEFLQQLGCEEIQGYYFSKPRPAVEIENLYMAGSSKLMVYNGPNEKT